MLISSLLATEISPKDLVILYNSENEESKKLAEYYQLKRAYPSSNILGIKMPNKGTISREEYEQIKNSIASKLADRLTTNQKNSLLGIVCMRGVPYRISATKNSNDQASFDSELALIRLQLPTKSALNNPYFKSKLKRHAFIKKNPGETSKPLLTCRIDGPSLKQCKQLIDDTLATEKTGLWGMCYLDSAQKHKLGDGWLAEIEKMNWERGIPTVHQLEKHCYNSHYPMEEAALYYGWYAAEKNGPLLDPKFRFKRGAIACHIHSFSGVNIRADKNWVGPLLNAGACVVLGNVYEPYLQMTTHLDIFQERLLDGYSLIEASSIATPVLSWQNIVIGDPLYRPYKHLKSVSGDKAPEDSDYRILNILWKLEIENEETLTRRLRSAAAKKESARLYECVGLWNEYNDYQTTAMLFYQSAESIYKKNSDKARCIMHRASLFKRQNQKQKAIRLLQQAIKQHGETGNATALQSQLHIYSPPLPPKVSQ